MLYHTQVLEFIFVMLDFFFETESCYIVQAGLELMILLLQTPK
jgi:hypothetical protein